MTKLVLHILTATLALSTCACGYLRSAVTGSMMEDVAAATAKHDDVDLVTAAAPTYILLLEGLLEGNPKSQRLLVAAAEAYLSYGTIVESEDLNRAGRLYARAKEYGLRALRQERGVGDLVEAPYPVYATIADKLDDADLPVVFWAASSWGAWIASHTESVTALAELPRVILLMNWVLERDESYYYASPHVFLGVYHAALPPMLGGDPDRARRHFDRALELTESRALTVHVQMARHYARQVYDRELYVSLLTKVLDSPVDDIPELTLQNRAAQRLAEQLLEETDAYF